MILLEPHGTRIPTSLPDLAAFRAWTRSDRFPEAGRIDWIAGEVHIDMSPESFNSHATPKAALVGDLRALVDKSGLGVTVTDSMRYVCEEADLSTEPDVVVLLYDSVESDRVRLVPRERAEDFVEIEGAADIVVEVVSDSSTKKDNLTLLAKYHAAGVREYWLVDARGEDVRFTLHLWRPEGFEVTAPDEKGFRFSEVLGLSVRLVRLAPRAGIVGYELESRR